MGFQTLSIRLGIDASTFDLDAPLPEIPPSNQSQSQRDTLVALARRENLTVRQLAQLMSGFGGLEIVGTAGEIADTMQSWLETGAADGFNIMFPTVPAGLDDFVTLVIPELQRRGIFRNEYEGTTLREHLGLPRPENRFLPASGPAWLKNGNLRLTTRKRWNALDDQGCRDAAWDFASISRSIPNEARDRTALSELHRSPSFTPAEHHAQVVRWHRNSFGRHEPVLIGERGDFVEVAYAPGWVARPQIRIERRVAVGGMHAPFAERAIEKQQPALRQHAPGARDQADCGGPGGDMRSC